MYTQIPRAENVTTTMKAPRENAKDSVGNAINVRSRMQELTAMRPKMESSSFALNQFRSALIANTISYLFVQDIPVAEVKPHPNYGKTKIGSAENDIMLVKLSRPAEFHAFAKPVCLPS